MEEIKYNVWEIEECVKNINDVTKQIKDFMKSVYEIDKANTIRILSNITNTLKYWTGNTYVGCPKDEPTQKAFNDFFNELYNLIWFIIKNDSFPNLLRSNIKEALYQGKLYRYLGYSSEEYHNLNDKSKHIIPNYNGVYVSWNKDNKNSYLESKLYGPITKLECEISGTNYGIDLTFFDVCTGDEKEVVFPTIESTITKIEYMDSEYNYD